MIVRDLDLRSICSTENTDLESSFRTDYVTSYSQPNEAVLNDHRSGSAVKQRINQCKTDKKRLIEVKQGRICSHYDNVDA